MNVLVWQWGRRGAGPRYAVALARAIAAVPGASAVLSLSTRAELLRADGPPDNALPVATYAGAAGYARRLLTAPLAIGGLARRIAALAPDVAICAMPGPLDLLMAAALRRLRVPHLVVIHDADAHPGDGLPLQMTLQRRLTAGADGLIALTDHVAARLRAQGLPRPGQTLLRASLPPLAYGPPPPPPGTHGGPLRLLSFGRLLSYKGLGLLADAAARLAGAPPHILRVVGSGPESPELDALRRLGATVENRWVPEDEVGPLLAWADALVLSHTEASQSGVAAAAIAAGRWIVATRVGGIAEQLAGNPGALLCDPDPESVAAAIRRLLTAPPPAPRAGAVPPATELVAALASLPRGRGVEGRRNRAP